MTYLNKVLYRKYLQDARQERLVLKARPWHCIFTGLDFNERTRNASYWQRMNIIQRLRMEG